MIAILIIIKDSVPAYDQSVNAVEGCTCCLRWGKGEVAHAVKAIGGENVQLHSFLTSAFDGGKSLTSRFGRFNLGKNRRMHLLWVWVGPRDGLDKRQILLPLLGFKSRTIQRVTHSLNRLRYRSSFYAENHNHLIHGANIMHFWCSCDRAS
jgi:hypothetical protein